MAIALLWANILIVAFALIDGLVRRGGYLHLPFLFAVSFSGWFLPQVFPLLEDHGLPHGSLDQLLFMSLLCMLVTLIGWRLGMKGAGRRPRDLAFDADRLVTPVALLTAFGVLMRILLELQPADARVASQQTGVVTIMYFLSRVSVVAFAVSLLLFTRKRTPAVTALLAINAAVYVPAVLIFFRRQETLELILVGLSALWFVKRFECPRILLVGAAVMGVFFVQGVGHLRELGGGYKLTAEGKIESRVPTLQEIASIDWLSMPKDDGVRLLSEARNGAYYMAVSDRVGYLFGAELWNELVFAYVPGQLIGFDRKRALMAAPDAHEIVRVETTYEGVAGATDTGFVQPYRDFWFFGAAVFGFIAFCLGRTFRSAQAGDWMSQVIYMSTVVVALMAITHSGYQYVVNSVNLYLSVAFVVLASRSSPARPESVAAGQFMVRRSRKSPFRMRRAP